MDFDEIAKKWSDGKISTNDVREMLGYERIPEADAADEDHKRMKAEQEKMLAKIFAG